MIKLRLIKNKASKNHEKNFTRKQENQVKKISSCVQLGCAMRQAQFQMMGALRRRKS